MNSTLFIIDDFTLGSPGQQLLDRFLIGTSDDFLRQIESNAPRDSGPVTLMLDGSADTPLISARVNDFGLKVVSDLPKEIPRRVFAITKRDPAEHLDWYKTFLKRDTPCFVYGLPEFTGARQLLDFAKQNNVVLDGGTESRHLFSLPEIPRFAETPERCAVVAQGGFPSAEARALEGFCSLSTPREAISSVTPMTGETLWNTAYSSEWLPCFASAVSRSNTIQGDPDRDGRTQDIVGLHLVEKLARKPRGWIVRAGSAEILLLVLDGALADMNIAATFANGKTVSTQLYNPPAPMRDAFSRMADNLKMAKVSRRTSVADLIVQAIDQMRARV